MADLDHPDGRLCLFLFRPEEFQHRDAGAQVGTGPGRDPAGYLPYPERHHLRYFPFHQRIRIRPGALQEADHGPGPAPVGRGQRADRPEPADERAFPFPGRRRQGDAGPGLFHRLALADQRFHAGHGLSALRQPDGPLDQAFRAGDEAVHLEQFPFDRCRTGGDPLRHFHPGAVRL